VPARKDNVELICSIGELAGLFEKSTSLQNFLQTAVSIVAYHMRAAVCSVYLLEDETNDLVMRANQGLNAHSVGRVRLKLGEGLTGTAVKELRPIREGQASRNPLYKFIPGIFEERYQAFLAVPIVRGTTRVGALVVQDPVIDYFDDNDTRALQAIASQLASVIENAKLLMSLRRQEMEPAPPVAADQQFVRGLPGAAGSAYGLALSPGLFDPAWLDDRADGQPFTADDFRHALRDTERQLEDLQSHLEERLADVASLIFSAHLLILKDEQFSGEMLRLIELGQPVGRAIGKVVDDYTRLFSRSSNPRLREKVQDVQDLARRLLRNLHRPAESASDYQGCVVVTADLMPSDMIKLAAERAEGLLLVGGGVTAHVSILARSLRIPVVVVEERGFLKLPPGTRVLLDGDQGTVYLNPGPELRAKYDELRAARQTVQAVAPRERPEAVSRDGQIVHVLANVNLLSEAKVARELNAGGIGLYRSEFPFIVRNDFPSEEEQYRVYRKLLEDMGGRPVVFRTLDVGGDKVLSYFRTVDEANPFLGLRALRFSLRNRDIFTQQLRALLRAGHDADLRIMFPMVSSVDDLLEARAVVESCIKDLAAERLPHHRNPQLGVMMELPSAVEIADELAAESDFLSIGSNDLVQYILAVDRTNEHIADLYMPHHPAVLRALKRIVDAAVRHGTPVSLCGAIAADRLLLPFLLGIGLRTVSVEVSQIPQVHDWVAQLDLREEGRRSARVLRLGRIKEVEQALAR
jgi:phosphotransferase system enzyme I (PtsP)